MNTFLQRLEMHADDHPEQIALRWQGGTQTYAELIDSVMQACARLSQFDARVLALDLENGPAWVHYDLAALALDVCIVPIPVFFSASQVRHTLTEAGIEAIMTDRPDYWRQHFTDLLEADHTALQACMPGLVGFATRYAWQDARNPVPAGTHKVTFTSGTTGTPAGVPLNWSQIGPVTQSLAEATRMGPQDQHLTLMPLAVLLENIAGLYAPLWAGGSIYLASMAEVGMQGSSRINGRMLAGALVRSAASTCILTPQTLQALVEALDGGHAPRPALRFCAVGGAVVAPRLLQRAEALGIPVFEGYGLSECCSVVCLNLPGANRPGSVGRALPHVGLALADDGELIVTNAHFKGYLGQTDRSTPFWSTGDLARIDEDGFVYLQGRRRNNFITSFGRNVSPEWVESELVLEAAIAQAAVFGEARPYNVAIITPAPGASAGDVEAAIARTNHSLPDYSRITRWAASDTGFSIANGMLTGTGRVRREHVWKTYCNSIQSLYEEDMSL